MLRLFPLLLVISFAGCDLPSVQQGNDAMYIIPDGGVVDLRVRVDGDPPSPALTIECDGAVDDIYLTPDDLPPFNITNRGLVVRCADVGRASRDEVAEELTDVEGVVVDSGYTMALIAYRTERDPGTTGLGTARLYVPDHPAAGPLPVVVVAHGTVGLADRCAPSRFPGPYDNALVLPWLARGLPTVVPDYAGLGNDGIQGYSNNADQAHSVIDAARAAIRSLTEGALDGRVIVVGHSQGGAAALAAHALWSTHDIPAIDLVAVVAISPGLTTENMAMAVENGPFVQFDDGGIRAIFAMMLYADHANLFGQAAAREFFAPALRDPLAEAVERQCIFELIETLDESDGGYLPPSNLGDMVDLNFQMGVTACRNDRLGCTEQAEAFVARCNANVLAFAPGPPVLMLTSADDTMVPPGRQACIRDALDTGGVEPHICVASGSDHMGIIVDEATFAVDWAMAVDSGEPPPSCPESGELPGCVGYQDL